MLSKQKLMNIGELKVSGIIDRMDRGGFEKYCEELQRFIQTLPSKEETLKSSLKAKDLDTFRRIFQELANTLALIHADELAKSCLKFAGEIKSSKQEVTEAYFVYLFTAISMLSIDIQMALSESGRDDDSAPMPKAAAPRIPDVEVDRAKLILAVDDVSITLNGLKMILKDMPEYKLVCVTSGATALRFLDNNTPDLFILDIEMPVMNGYELAKKIRLMGKRAPIVFLTGNATAEYVRMAMQSGASDFIVKPVNKEIVLSKIKKFTDF